MSTSLEQLLLYNKAINSELIDSYGNYPNSFHGVFNYEYTSYEIGSLSEIIDELKGAGLLDEVCDYPDNNAVYIQLDVDNVW